MNTLRHVWRQMLANRLFTGIYIFGTALSIASVLLMGAFLYSKVASFYPEDNRSRTAYINYGEGIDPNSGEPYCASPMNTRFIREYLYTLKTPDVVSARNIDSRRNFARKATGKENIALSLAWTDPGFFDVYTYRFVDGKPFSKADFESGVATAAISQTTAQKIFGTVTGAVGREIEIDHRKYTVCGIYKDGFAIANHSYADAILPYTCMPDEVSRGNGFGGTFKVVILADDLDAVREELAVAAKRYNETNDEMHVGFGKSPISHVRQALGVDGTSFGGDGDIPLEPIMALFILMLIPSLNLSGLISGRMEGRLVEMGVRKSYGATSAALLRLVLVENFVFTCVGALAGYIAAWILFRCGMLAIFMPNPYGYSLAMPDEVFLSPELFLFVFAVSLVLNLLSAFVPAWIAMRKPIVSSLKK